MPHDELLQLACRLIQARIGVVVPKLYEERIDLGLRRAQAAANAASLEATLAALQRLPCVSAPWQAAIGAITVGETSFLRHREWFAEIENVVLAPLIEVRRQRGPKRIDLWSAGCSTGEEAYSLAMIVDRLLPDRSDWTVRIIGTDINTAALARAREAVYHAWSVRELEAPLIAQYFEQIEHGRYRLSGRLRQMVDFKTLNLGESVYPDPGAGLADFDLIICRNVLIYLSDADQQAVAGRLVRTLAPDGWLAVSPAEAAAELYRPLVAVNRPGAIFFSKDATELRPRWSAPLEAARPAPTAACRRTPRRPGAAVARTLRPDGGTVIRAVAPAVPRSGDERGVLSRARDLADCGRHADARLGCESFIAAHGLDFDAHLLLATVCLDMDDLPAAREAARCATYLDPDSPAAHYLLGSILYRLGSRDAAQRKMAVVMRLLQMLPEDANVARHFDATAGALRESARGYLTNSVAEGAEGVR